MASTSPAGSGDTRWIGGEPPPAKRARRNIPSAQQGRHREIGLMRWRPKEDSASFVGSASGIHFIRSVYSAAEVENSSLASPVTTPDQNLVPGEEDQLLDSSDCPTPKSLWLPDETSSGPVDGDYKIPLRDLLDWSQSYFDNWHPAFPYLHAPMILKTFKDISQVFLSQLTDTIPSSDLTVIRAILSISLADRRQSFESPTAKPVPTCLVYHSYSAAIDGVHGTLATPTTIKTLQAVMSVQLFLVSMLRYNAASRLGGLAVRMAFQIGLHRCPVRYSTFTSENVQLRKRIFWTIYCMDRHLCQALGLPLGIRDDDLDVCYLDQESHVAGTGVEFDLDDRLTLLQYLVRHAEIKGLIVELCNKAVCHRQTDPDAATNVRAKTHKWWNDIESYLDTPDSVSPVLSSYHETTLTILHHECTIALNRPLLAMPKDTADYKEALQSCISAARTIIDILHRSFTGSDQTRLSIGHRSKKGPISLLWPSFTWAIWQSAFIILYAAIECELPKTNANKLAEQGIDVLKHVSSRGSIWANACAAAIRDLRRHLDKSLRQIEHDIDPARQQAVYPPPSRASSDQVERHGHPSTVVGPNGIPGKGNHHATASNGLAQQQSILVQQDSNPMPINIALQCSAVSTNPTADELTTQTAQLNNYNAYNTNAPPAAGSVNHKPSAEWPESNSIFDINNMELFEGFDIPFWLDDDQYAPFLGDSGE